MIILRVLGGLSGFVGFVLGVVFTPVLLLNNIAGRNYAGVVVAALIGLGVIGISYLVFTRSLRDSGKEKATGLNHGRRLIVAGGIPGILLSLLVMSDVGIGTRDGHEQSYRESAAISHMRTITSAEYQFQAGAYRDKDGDGIGDFGTLAQLSGVDPPLIDPELAAGSKREYQFTLEVRVGAEGVEPGFWATALPEESGQTGHRSSYVDESAVIRFTADGSVPDGESEELPP